MNRFSRDILAICIAGAALAPRICAAQPADNHPQPASPRTPAPVEVGEIGRRIAAAAPGAVVEIGPGVYHEHLRIDKSITLVGRDNPIIDGGGNGDIIEISAPDVQIRGFTIRNTGIDLDKENAAIRVTAPRVVIEDNLLKDILFGIDLRESPDSVIRGNTIGGKLLDIARRGDGLRLWRSNNALVERNSLHDGRDAIIWYSSNVTARHNRSVDCRYGLHLMFSDSVTIDDNELTGNSVGIYLMYSTGIEIRRNKIIRNRGPSGYGIGLKEADRFTVSDNLIAQNRVGVYIDGSPFTTKQPGIFTRNTLAYNDIGFTFLPSARGNELTENNFIDNIDQVAVAGRGRLDANKFWKGERGNFWSDYTGYDQNADGIGDFIHESQTLFENMMDREPKLRLFLFSPAQQAIEFIGRALPTVQPEPKFADEVPLMRPVPMSCDTSLDSPPIAPLASTGFALLALGGSIVLLARAERRDDRRRATTPGTSYGHPRDGRWCLMIKIDHVTRRFGRSVAVDDLSLTIAPGESVALSAPNGAGKTTLIRCVLGLLRFQGHVSVGGHDLRRYGKLARMLIGYVPQELGFYDDLGVAEALRFFGKLKNVAVRSADDVLAGVGLEGHAHKRIRELSGGMKQRLALAIALLGDPPVLVLDEVTASLDVCGRGEFVSLLSGLAGSGPGEGGRTMLFASHRVDEVTALADRVVKLEQGRAVSVTTAHDFAASLASGMVLHLVMPSSVRERAMGHLRSGGFRASLNGVGLLVPVSPDQKAAPFRLLSGAGITIDDFEILSDSAASAAAHSHQELRP